MASLLSVPEVAAGATEAVLSEWLVEENAPFVAGEPIADDRDGEGGRRG